MLNFVFGLLKVLERAPSLKGRVRWRCSCACGKNVVVSGTSLRSGKTKSCGCLRASNMRKVATTHGHSSHVLYNRWLLMHARCYDPENNRYYRYGARGIRVCKRWHNFEKYLQDVETGFKDGLTLDRIDNNKDYGPKNFRWASYTQQALNKSTSVTKETDIPVMRALYKKGSLTQAQVGEIFGLTRDTVKHYLRNIRAR